MSFTIGMEQKSRRRTTKKGAKSTCSPQVKEIQTGAALSTTEVVVDEVPGRPFYWGEGRIKLCGQTGCGFSNTINKRSLTRWQQSRGMYAD